MSLDIVRKQIKKYLLKDKPEVLAVKGGWGVGKTYSWNEFLKINKQEITCSRYSYVSLFGINSISELKQAIFENIVKKELIGTHPTIDTFNENRMKFFEVWGRKASFFARKLPIIQDFSATFDSIAFISITNILICMDDIERKGKNLTIRDIFGLITQLKEQKYCKIVLLLNDNEEGLDEYHKYREKVIDMELIFAPTSKECNSIVFGEDDSYYNYMKECCQLLEIKNIRILYKIKQLFDECCLLCLKFEPEVISQIAHSLTLFSWAFYNKSENVPTIEYICNTNYLAFSLLDNKEIDEKESKWNSLISSYGYQNTDAFDRIIARTILQGYIIEGEFIELANEQNEKIIARKKEDSFSFAWKMYHNSFDDDEDETVMRIYDSFKLGVKYISRTNLNGTVSLLRDFMHDDKASEIIDLYIAEHKDEFQVFDLSENDVFNEITDQEVMKKFSEAIAVSKKPKLVSDIICSLALNMGWSKEDEEILANTTSEEYYEIYKNLKVENLPACINVGLRYGRLEEPTENQKKIYNNVKNALIKIGGESKINKRRLIRYGIKIE